MNETQMKRGANAAKVGTTAAAEVALAACAACCAPLAAPLLAWFGLSSLGMATIGRYLKTAVVSAIALVGLLLFRRHKAMSNSQTCRVDENYACGSNFKS